MDTANCTKALNATASERVSGTSALWGVITLAMNAMQQPSIFESKSPPSQVSWSRASPLVCLGDVLCAIGIILTRRMDNYSWGGAIEAYMTEFRMTDARSSDASMTSLAGILFFTLGVVPQALKIFCMKGDGVIYTQIMCGLYFIAGLVSNLLNILTPSDAQYSALSSTYPEDGIFDVLRDRTDASSFCVANMVISPTILGFMVAPCLLFIDQDKKPTGRFFEPSDPFSYGTILFFGLLLTTGVIWFATLVALIIFSTGKRLQGILTNDILITTITLPSIVWAFTTAMFSGFGIVSGIIVACLGRDPWGLLKGPMVTIHIMCWLGVLFPFTGLLLLCIVIFSEGLQSLLGKSQNRTVRLDARVKESGFSDRKYGIKLLNRYWWPVFGLLHFRLFALVYLIKWDDSETKKARWTEFLG